MEASEKEWKSRLSLELLRWWRLRLKKLRLAEAEPRRVPFSSPSSPVSELLRFRASSSSSLWEHRRSITEWLHELQSWLILQSVGLDGNIVKNFELTWVNFSRVVVWLEVVTQFKKFCNESSSIKMKQCKSSNIKTQLYNRYIPPTTQPIKYWFSPRSPQLRLQRHCSKEER